MGGWEQVALADKLMQHDVGEVGGEMTPVGDGHLRVSGTVKYVDSATGGGQAVTPVAVVDESIGRRPPTALPERLPLIADQQVDKPWIGEDGPVGCTCR